MVPGYGVLLARRTDPKSAAHRTEGLALLERGILKGSVRRAPWIDRTVQARSQWAARALILDRANGFYGGAPASAHAEPAYVQLGLRTVSGMMFFEGSRPLVRGETIFATMGDQVVAYGRDSGKQLWARPLNGDVKSAGGSLGSSPSWAGGFLFVGTQNGAVLQLDPSNGQVVRRYPVGQPVRSQPLIHEGRLYVTTTGAKLVVIDTRNASLTGWSAWGGSSSRNSLVQ